jgi:hypothetical protein
MTRILWIIGLSIALLMFVAFAILSGIALIFRNHYSIKAWAVLLSMGYGARFLYTCLRSAIRYGDPTANMARADSNLPFSR